MRVSKGSERRGEYSTDRADAGGGVDWVSSHPPMGFNCQQEQIMQHKNYRLSNPQEISVRLKK